MSARGPPEECAVDHTLERRSFLKAAGAAAGFMIAGSSSAFSYAQNSKVRIGCIGVGAQGVHNIREGLTHTPEALIVAIAEVYKPNQDAAAIVSRLSNAKQYVPEGQAPGAEQLAAIDATPAPSLSYDYREVLANPNVDAVIISTPPRAQFQIVIDALNAGKYVFCETPLVRSVEQGRYLVEKCHSLGRWVQVGYQRRYNPKYNLAQSLVYERGMVGRITHISAQSHENISERRPLPEGYVLNEEERKHITDLDKHLNWRLYSDHSRGLYTGAALHHLDAANWFLRSVPSRVFAAGGQDYWEDGRTNDDNMVVVCEYDLKTGSPGHIPIKSRTTLMNEATANQNYTVRVVHSSLTDNSARGVCGFVQGDRGSLTLGENICKYHVEPWTLTEIMARGKFSMVGPETNDWVVQILRAERLRGIPQSLVEEDVQAYTRMPSGSSPDLKRIFARQHTERALRHGLSLLDSCGDLDVDKTPSANATAFQFRAFADCIREGARPRNNEMVAFASAVSMLAALESRRRGEAIQVDPAWFSFDFEPPSTHEYDPSWAAMECEPPKCECCGQPMKDPEKPVCPKCGAGVPPNLHAPCPC